MTSYGVRISQKSHLKLAFLVPLLDITFSAQSFGVMTTTWAASAVCLTLFLVALPGGCSPRDSSRKVQDRQYPMHRPHAKTGHAKGLEGQPHPDVMIVFHAWPSATYSLLCHKGCGCERQPDLSRRIFVYNQCRYRGDCSQAGN